MLINGLWCLCDDGIIRPVIQGEALNSAGEWHKISFLVDTGADRTVFCADDLSGLGLSPLDEESLLEGVGGAAPSIVVETQIRLPSVDLGRIAFKGHYAAFTQLESLDMSVLGRDILNLFALIVDRQRDVVCLLGQRHRYEIKHA